jgi:2-methylcitrate dehydratase PrpD
VLGRTEKTDILNAALLNGISSHVLDFDDTHLRTVIHPAGAVASAILALAEHRPVSGEDFLHALILGIEVECRIGNAVYPAHYDVGWHITGTAGVFGAAAATGRLLRLSHQQMRWALGIAATQASGLQAMFGSMCKSFHVGRAAQGGLSAALLAAKGFTSSEQAIEAPKGFANVLSTERDYTEITEALGERFELLLNTYKPFPCGVCDHPTIDGCLQLRRKHALTPIDIDRVNLKVHPLVLELTGNRSPRLGLEGKFSVYHSAAVALVRGKVGVSEYTDEAVNDPEIVALRERITAEGGHEINIDQADVMITLTDGRTLHTFVEHAIGSADKPMSDDDLDLKVQDLCDPILGRDAVRNLISVCRGVLNLDAAASIATAATPTIG